ncbi:hypothetical protein DFS34DRAFT_691923 [Phlyctochytrium arcticum]|nr:hypothetical protein DFS34DRAFT_691923 [Phlyctochytrium arcticum]
MSRSSATPSAFGSLRDPSPTPSVPTDRESRASPEPTGEDDEVLLVGAEEGQSQITFGSLDPVDVPARRSATTAEPMDGVVFHQLADAPRPVARSSDAQPPAPSSIDSRLADLHLDGTQVRRRPAQEQTTALKRDAVEREYAKRIAELEAKLAEAYADVAQRSLPKPKGESFDNLEYRALHKVAVGSVYSGSKEENSPERIRDFLSAHYDFLDHPGAGIFESKRIGRKYVAYIGRHLKNAAKSSQARTAI